jgi:hypothetical protein
MTDTAEYVVVQSRPPENRSDPTLSSLADNMAKRTARTITEPSRNESKTSFKSKGR